ncbi:SUF system Fe-S cluster assembly protein [Marinicauda salina]|uniref:SUF system Fe-S cluster assembly protein n=1 Tax=Marinicauda salina TaxID=2135793 RepID=A0A2U2BV32_9PROT|nr:SUF system Fe-S cluster assembly protein [Marinicauda salina]
MRDHTARAEAAERDVIDLNAPAAESATQSEPAADESAGVAPALSDKEIARVTDDVVAALKSVYDPEIPVDIYELGLIYKVDLEDDRTLKVEMTLTAPGCPVAGEMPGWVQEACNTVEGVERTDVTLTFDPPWTPDRMSDEARLQLNML